jgi:hypothetical protein
MDKIGMNPNAIERRFVKGADNVATAALVAASNVSSQPLGVCGISHPPNGSVMTGATVAAGNNEGNTSFVAGVVQHLQEIIFHHLSAASFVIGAAFAALTIELFRLKVSHRKRIPNAATNMMRSAISARPYSRALYTILANTVAKITQIIRDAFSQS